MKILIDDVVEAMLRVPIEVRAKKARLRLYFAWDDRVIANGSCEEKGREIATKAREIIRFDRVATGRVLP